MHDISLPEGAVVNNEILHKIDSNCKGTVFKNKSLIVVYPDGTPPLFTLTPCCRFQYPSYFFLHLCIIRLLRDPAPTFPMNP